MNESAAFDRIGILGTGRVATALGKLLAVHSRKPVSIWGRNQQHAASLSEILDRSATVSQLRELLLACDCIFLAVSDDALAEVVAKIDGVLAGSHTGFLFHVSGRSGVSAIRPLADRGMLTAAIHPVMTFTGQVQVDTQNVTGAHFAITAATPAALVKANEVVELLGGVGVEISEDDRLLYHAALAHVANHFVTLVAQATSMLEAANVREPAKVFAPLARAALENSLTSGFDALSGPLLRGDRNTIAGHLASLEQNCPDALPAYRAMAIATLDELAREGKPVSNELRRLLAYTISAF